MQAGLLFSLWSRVEADVVEEGNAEKGPPVGIVCRLLHLEGNYPTSLKDAERTKVKGPKERVQKGWKVMFWDCQPEARFHTRETGRAVQSSLRNSGCLIRDAYSEGATFVY